MMNGFINVYKEKGYTSHDVVAKLRGILKQKRIGHTGTLDPAAEGVLPVCLGRATRLAEEISAGTKTYRAVMILGVETDTWDMEGRMLYEKAAAFNFSEINAAVSSFIGEVLQVPPMYSARKVDGKRLYELAREGREVERKPAPVRFYDISIVKYDLPEVTLHVTCSKGTYIRSLCHDIGAKLGCGGTLKSLLRTRVGRFELEDAMRLSEIQLFADRGRISEAMLTVPDMFPELPRAHTGKEYDAAALNGNILQRTWFAEENALAGKERILVYNSEGRLIGLYRKHAEEDAFVPDKMLLED
ncbi:MAG: tRNA pseudouridine(55) synthase TruB [Eubacterium sp.]|nr:tRNA pseudouridine(55) synthase TruB [Eubacterium sp.]